MNYDETNEAIGFDVEAEWVMVDKLLSQKTPAAWGMAVVTAHKIFSQAISEISFGETTEEQIHNAAEVIGDMTKLLQADELYYKVVNEVGYLPTQEDAKTASGIMLRVILDMTGRDFQQMGAWHRLNNNLNFFWGNHPRFLVYVLSGVLLFVGVVWALDQTPIGKWLTDLAVGFAEFVVGNEALLIGLMVAWLIAMILSAVFYRRR